MDENSDRHEPLLLLPGLMCDERLFAKQLAAFPTARVAADYADCRDLGAMAERVLATAAPRFALLGHSMGGRVALEVYRRAPERVTRLVLASTGVHALREGEQASRHRLRDLGRSEGMAALVEDWLPPMLSASSAQNPGLVAELAAMCRDAGLARFEAQIAALLARPEVASLLPTIDCRVLVLVGSEDRWSDPQQHATIAAAIPGAELVEIDGAGHMLPIEAPVAFNAALARWLAYPQQPVS